MLQQLFNDIITRKIVSLSDCTFEIDGCTCYYVFYDIGNKIELNIKLDYFYKNEFEKTILTSYNCAKKIQDFELMIDIMKKRVQNGTIVKNTLKDKKEYEKNIGYCELLSIKLDKCYICYEYVLNKEHLKCGHLIHTKCAEQYFKIKKHFKCGVCREDYGEHMYFYEPNLIRTNYESDDETEEAYEPEEPEEPEEGENSETEDDTEDDYDGDREESGYYNSYNSSVDV